MRVGNAPARAPANAWRWRLHLPRGVALHDPRASAAVGVREVRRSPAAASPAGGNTECGLRIRNGWSVLNTRRNDEDSWHGFHGRPRWPRRCRDCPARPCCASGTRRLDESLPATCPHPSWSVRLPWFRRWAWDGPALSLIHISEPTRLGMISYAVFCLKKKNILQYDY